MDIVVNEQSMYRSIKDNHVQVLTASLRNVNHLMDALHLGSDIITVPFKIFKEWAAGGFQVPKENYMYDVPGLSGIPYSELNLDEDWRTFNLAHELTTAGLAKFWEDWKSIVK